MRISDIKRIKEAPVEDPVKVAQDSLQRAKEGAVAIQTQMSQLAAQKKVADEQIRAAQQAVAAAQRTKSQQRQAPAATGEPMGTPNTATGSAPAMQ